MSSPSEGILDLLDSYAPNTRTTQKVDTLQASIIPAKTRSIQRTEVPVGKLSIFISSDTKEFSNERPRLKRLLEDVMSEFLSPVLLEKSGAKPQNVREISLRMARESDVYVGLLGRDFSELTRDEFREAWKANKPCFVYVEVKQLRRDSRVTKFIKNEIKPNLKYHTFHSRSELFKQVREDLTIFLAEVLSGGIKRWTTIQREEREHRVIPTTPAMYQLHYSGFP